MHRKILFNKTACRLRLSDFSRLIMLFILSSIIPEFDYPVFLASVN